MKEGYDFLGWYDNSSLTGNSISSIGTNEEGDKYFYAKWNKKLITSVTHDNIGYGDIVQSDVKSNFFRRL